MIFKNDKKLLKIIKSQSPKLPNNYYDWEDIYRISGMSNTDYLISLRSLAENEIISFGDQSKTAFRLEANGLYFNEYQKQNRIQYIMDKLVDFFALIVAIIALIISIA